MTGPKVEPYNYDQEARSTMGAVDAAVAGTEWSAFLARRKELLDTMMASAMQGLDPARHMDPEQSGAHMAPVAPGSTLAKPTPTQIGQAHFWDITNPEGMSAAELQHQIDQRRLEVPKEQQTSLTSALFAGGAAAAQAAGSAAELIGNAFQNVGHTAAWIPFIGPSLQSMMAGEQSKLFWQTLQSRASEAVEAAKVMQPDSDQGAFQFLTGAGKMAGYALPAIAAWEGLGAAAGIPRLSWAAQAGTPILRAAAKGALVSAIVQDPDAPVESKVMNIGLGAVLGGANMWGKVGTSVALGTVGAGIGAQIGDTPEERQQHMLEYGVGGATLPFLAPALANAFQKVKAAFPDGVIPAEGWTPPGIEDAQYTIERDAPQVSGNPVPPEFKLGAGVPPDQGGPGGGLPSPQTPEDLHRLIAGGGEPAPIATSPGAAPEPQQLGALGAPRVTGYLESGIASSNVGDSFSNMMAQADHFRRIGTDVEYARDVLRNPALQLTDQPEFAPHDQPTTITEYYTAQADRIESSANAARYKNRELESMANSLPGTVSQGPDHLLGSKVAAVDGQPLRVYHGTDAAFEQFDPAKIGDDNLFGKGLYHTESPEIAAGYTSDQSVTVAFYQRELAGVEADIQRAQAVEASGQAIASPESRAAYMASLQREHAELTEQLAKAQTAAPNIRPAFLDIKNPYNIDAKLSPQEAHQVVDRMEYFNPDYQWNDVRDWISKAGNAADQSDFKNQDGSYNAPGHIDGEDLYRQMEQVNRKFGEGEIQPNAWDPNKNLPAGVPLLYDPLAQLGDQLNDALANAGYDGITHIGGQRTGNPPHRVWIAFNPSQVHPYYSTKALTLEQAPQVADAITKQATVMESSTLPTAVGKVQPTEADVVQAAQSNNPGGLSIVKGIGRPLDIMAEHPDVSFIERNGSLDALVGDFSDEQKSQYQRFGTYSGNVVTTASGIEGEVVSINNGMAVLRRTQGGPPLRVKAENLLPSRYSTPVYEGKDLWPSFKADFLRYMNEEVGKAGMAPVESLYDPRATSLMQTHIEDYLTRRGISDQGTRHAINLSLNNSWVEETRALDPESQAMQARLGDEAAIESNDREDGPLPIPYSLEEKAEPRGFVWISNVGADGGTLKDILNPEGAAEFPVETDQAAEEFLQRVDRSAPDLTPASDVPVETMEYAPTDETFDPRLGHEETVDTYEEDLDADEAELDRTPAPTSPYLEPALVGGDGSPATLSAAEPSGGGGRGLSGGGGGGGTFEGGGPARIGPSGETLGDQFARVYRTSPETWAALERRWTGNHFRYTRYLMANLENDLVSNGIDLGRAWAHVTDLETARTKADNEAFDWLREAGDIMRSYGPKRKVNPLFRNGFITRTHEIQDPVARSARWDTLKQKGFTDAEVKQMRLADEHLTDFYHRLFVSGVESPSINFRPEQEIQRYISHVRQRQAQGVPGQDVYNSDGLLSPQVQFFAEYAREGNMQFRVMDTRALVNHYIRSMMFKKYQAEPYETLVTAWQDPRIPENIRSLLLDHARAMRFGYRPEPTMAVKAVRGVVEGMLGVPITTSEAARLTGGPLGWLYRSLLGGKTSIFFRDATQPLMALSKVRTNHMADAYQQVLSYWRKGEGRDQMLEDYATMLKHGVVARERPAMESLATFEEQSGSDNQLLALTDQQAAARERAARVGDVMMPHWLERFDDKVNTLRLYGKEQRLNQFIPGIAAYKQAKVGLGEYRRSQVQAALEGNPSLAMDYSGFAKKSFFSSFQPAIQQRLQELVDKGDDEEAAATFAREVVKWSQHVYTVREKPAMLRGGFGRFASFLGNWSGQFLEAVNASLRYGEPAHRARALMVLGGFSYVMKKLGEKLGMRNLSSWAWSSALHYAGSPLLERAAQAVQAYGGVMALAEDRKTDPMQGEAIQQLPSLVGSGTDFFPYGGYLRTADALTKAAQGINPAGDITRFMISGDRGSRVDYLLQSRQRAEALRARLEGTPLGGPPAANSSHPGTGARQ